LRKTYILEEGPPAADFTQYATVTAQIYSDLLATATEERQLQEFFEHNPCFLPGSSSPGSHGPLYDMLISQPRLPGLSSHAPDFMWITSHSARWFPTLIEIEHPAKRLFTKAGIPTSDFTQAHSQLIAWRSWFSEPSNVDKFIADYAIPEDIRRGRIVEPRFLLIYGRRREFEKDTQLSKFRASLMTSPDEELISFDRLSPSHDLHDALTVRAKGHGRYEALAVMPTLRLGPHSTEGFPHVEGLVEAVTADERISRVRREFLARRIPYWRTWKEDPEMSIVGNDFE